MSLTAYSPGGGPTMRTGTTIALLLMSCLIQAGCGNTGPAGGDDPQAPRLTWDAPASDTDGSPLTDLAGYRVYYGTEPGTYSGSLTVEQTTFLPLAVLSAAVPSPGRYFVAVSAFDADGNESAFSNEISKDL